MSAFNYPNSLKRVVIFSIFTIVVMYALLSILISYVISTGQYHSLVTYAIFFIALSYIALAVIMEIWGEWIILDPKYRMTKEQMEIIGKKAIVFKDGKPKFKV